MTLRLTSLEDIDPLAVPLPNGTEVTTRVDRVLGETTVPQGAVGRVSAQADPETGALVVTVVGVGELTYLRSELIPRKSGQLRFAMRRAASWKALEATIILETVVGSRAWGLADETSDTDRRGVFALPFPWTVGLLDGPTDLVSADGSSTYWEVGKAIRQATRAEPNTLETLLLPGATARDELGQWLLDARDAFASTEIHGTFGRYALGQLTRLSQSLRLAEHRSLVLSWLRHEPTLDLDAAAARLAREASVEAPTTADAVARSRDYIKQLYSSLFDRGLVAERNYQAMVAFARADEHTFELPRELRPKNAYNLLRLIACATGWLQRGRPEFVVAEPLRSELVAIKRGEIDLARIIERAEELARDLEAARRTSVLPPKPDIVRIDGVLRRIREEIARRWVGQVPGPFGAGAPTPPEVTWRR